MKSVVDAVVGTMMLLGIGLGAYHAVKTEALLRVHKGLPSLEKYTRKLTGTKLPF